MDEKDNVCVEEMQKTEQQVTIEQEKAGSAVLGKFKDVDALARAYRELQAEFTKRCQRLKELEKTGIDEVQLDNSGKSGVLGEKGVEKLRTHAKTVKERERAFDAFVNELESKTLPVGSDQADKEPDGSSSSVEKVDTTALDGEKTGVFEEDFAVCENMGTEQKSHANPDGVAAAAEFSSDALYQAVKLDEKVRMKIIGDYLDSIRRSDAPLMKGGVGGLATPSVRAKTLSDAGTMALRYFKKSNSDA